MDTELLGFRAEESASFTDEINVPGGGGMDTGGKSSRTVDITYSQRAIFGVVRSQLRCGYYSV